nr:cytochrome c [uncultured bacterium]
MKNFKIAAIATSIVLLLAACGGGDGAPKQAPGSSGAPGTNDGSGKAASNLFTSADLDLGDIDQGMVAKGKEIYDVKCQACHSLGPNRVVGPGWKGVTERREPAWIMNMTLNIDAMLADDEEAQKLLEECLVRMPNQGLTKDDGRNVLEFMRTL